VRVCVGDRVRVRMCTHTVSSQRVSQLVCGVKKWHVCVRVCVCVWVCVSKRRCWFPQLRSNSAVTQSPCECRSSSALLSLWSVCVCECIYICVCVCMWGRETFPLSDPLGSVYCVNARSLTAAVAVVIFTRTHIHTQTQIHTNSYNSDTLRQLSRHLGAYATLTMCMCLHDCLYMCGVFLMWGMEDADHALLTFQGQKSFKNVLK